MIYPTYERNEHGFDQAWLNGQEVCNTCHKYYVNKDDLGLECSGCWLQNMEDHNFEYRSEDEY